MKKLFVTITLAILASYLFSQNAIQVQKSGSGDPILYLPGFTCPGSVWNDINDNIELSHESHLVSYAGFNGIKPVEMPWYPKLLNDLKTYIEQEKLNNITIIAHSMGGNLAIDLATELPEKVKAIVLVESIPCLLDVIMPGVPANTLVYESPYNQQMLQMPEEQFIQMANMQAVNMTNDSTKVETLKNWILSSDRKTYVYGFTDLLKLNQKDQLEKVKAKSLIIGALFPNQEQAEATYKSQYEKLESKEIYFATNSKHFVMFDQPEWLTEKINEFLRDEE